MLEVLHAVNHLLKRGMGQHGEVPRYLHAELRAYIRGLLGLVHPAAVGEEGVGDVIVLKKLDRLRSTGDRF